MKSQYPLKSAALLCTTIALTLLPAAPSEALDLSTAFLLGAVAGATTYHTVRPNYVTVVQQPAVQRTVEQAFPSYALTRLNMRSERTKYLKLPRVRGHICGHDGFCLGH
jgi:hypothetical protein